MTINVKSVAHPPHQKDSCVTYISSQVKGIGLSPCDSVVGLHRPSVEKPSRERDQKKGGGGREGGVKKQLESSNAFPIKTFQIFPISSVQYSWVHVMVLCFFSPFNTTHSYCIFNNLSPQQLTFLSVIETDTLGPLFLSHVFSLPHSSLLHPPFLSCLLLSHLLPANASGFSLPALVAAPCSSLQQQEKAVQWTLCEPATSSPLVSPQSSQTTTGTVGQETSMEMLPWKM